MLWLPLGNTGMVERLTANQKRSIRVAQNQKRNTYKPEHYGPVESTSKIALSEFTALPAAGTVPITFPAGTVGSLLKN